MCSSVEVWTEAAAPDKFEQVRTIFSDSIKQDTVMNRGAHLEPSDCPIDRTLKIIGGRWKPLILFHLRKGSRRFNELRRLMPTVTQRMLSQHLRELEQDGIISRTVYPVVPPRVDYALTDLGMTLWPVLEAMAEWGERFERQPSAPDRETSRAA